MGALGMYLITVATDYDGTLAHHGRVDAATIAALQRLKASGRKLVMVTGRELPDLKRISNGSTSSTSLLPRTAHCSTSQNGRRSAWWPSRRR
jgi:HAD superfamily hydrolase (TIGR01484 family)